jgi:uncharacterized protein (DUF58 family)
VREREWQAAQSVTLWVDRARAMAFSGAKDRAAERATGRGFWRWRWRCLLLRGGERVGLAGGHAPRRAARS